MIYLCSKNITSKSIVTIDKDKVKLNKLCAILKYEHDTNVENLVGSVDVDTSLYKAVSIDFILQDLEKKYNIVHTNSGNIFYLLKQDLFNVNVQEKNIELYEVLLTDLSVDAYDTILNDIKKSLGVKYVSNENSVIFIGTKDQICNVRKLTTKLYNSKKSTLTIEVCIARLVTDNNDKDNVANFYEYFLKVFNSLKYESLSLPSVVYEAIKNSSQLINPSEDKSYNIYCKLDLSTEISLAFGGEGILDTGNGEIEVLPISKYNNRNDRFSIKANQGGNISIRIKPKYVDKNNAFINIAYSHVKKMINKDTIYQNFASQLIIKKHIPYIATRYKHTFHKRILVKFTKIPILSTLTSFLDKYENRQYNTEYIVFINAKF